MGAGWPLLRSPGPECWGKSCPVGTLRIWYPLEFLSDENAVEVAWALECLVFNETFSKHTSTILKIERAGWQLLFRPNSKM